MFGEASFGEVDGIVMRGGRRQRRHGVAASNCGFDDAGGAYEADVGGFARSRG